MTASPAVSLTYFSDVLCIWAYAAQARLDEAHRVFGDSIAIDVRFCSVFGDTADKIERHWARKGGYEGFNRHVMEVAEGFDHIAVHPEIWLTCRPASSESAHLFVKAASLAGGNAHEETAPGRSPGEDVAWRLRRAFFAENRDIATRKVQDEVAEEMGLDMASLEAALRNGSAHAALMADHREKERHRIEGSPTFVMNEGRQKIYGNVGYRVIEANIRELMHEHTSGAMSWC